MSPLEPCRVRDCPVCEEMTRETGLRQEEPPMPEPAQTAVTCDEGVSRRGEYAPCERPAVAMRVDPEGGNPYPVCIHHTRAEMVPLRGRSITTVIA